MSSRARFIFNVPLLVSAPSAGSKASARGYLRSAFTLVELMVVIGIIGLLVAISVPAMGPLLSANEFAQVKNTLGGMVTTAHSTAEAIGTPVAIRIEHSFTPHRFSFNTQYYEGMRDFQKPADVVSFLPHQQARLVRFFIPTD